MACSTSRSLIVDWGVLAPLPLCLPTGMMQRGFPGICRQDVRADQAVGDNHIGTLEPAKRLDSQQFGIAGAGADENDFSRYGWIWLAISFMLL